MRYITYLIAAVCVLSAAPDADARGFTISDFGPVASDRICVTKARLMFQRFGAGEVKSTEWTVNAYRIGGEDTLDAAVICAYGPNGQTQVSLVLHGSGDSAQDARRTALPDRLLAIWNSL